MVRLVNSGTEACMSVLINSQMAELVLTTPNREPRRVEFSRVYGKRATLIFDGEEVAHFGDDADDLGLGNFFGA